MKCKSLFQKQLNGVYFFVWPHHIEPAQLTLHAARGSSMKSKAVAELLVDLGVIKTHSRPHVSDDNPFSEAQFKTLNTARSFPIDSAASRMPEPFVQIFSPGKTTITSIRASAWWPRTRSTTVWLKGFITLAARCWKPLSKKIQSASRVVFLYHLVCPMKSGSINQKRKRTKIPSLI